MNVFKITFISNYTGEVVERTRYGGKWPTRLSAPACMGDSHSVDIDVRCYSAYEYISKLCNDINFYTKCIASPNENWQIENNVHNIESILKEIKKVNKAMCK